MARAVLRVWSVPPPEQPLSCGRASERAEKSEAYEGFIPNDPLEWSGAAIISFMT